MGAVFGRHFPRRAGLIVSVVTAVGLLASCAGAPQPESAEAGAAGAAAPGAFPVTIENCGRTVTLSQPPERAVTLNQGATEVALALGLEDRLAGTAYLDGEVAKQWDAAYRSVPVLSEEYPSKEVFLTAKPDLAYASYSSAFEAENVGTRAELAAHGVPTYLSPFGCPGDKHQPEASFESVWSEITDIARVFGVPQRAEKVVRHQQQQLDQLHQASPGKGIEVFWWDSQTKSPYAGAGEGGPQLILDAVGATNIFGHLDEAGWVTVSWEKVVAADPEVIVFADASWSSAKKKIAYLESDPVLSRLTAVREHRYVTVPYAASTPGVRLIDGAQTVAEQLAEFDELGEN